MNEYPELAKRIADLKRKVAELEEEINKLCFITCAGYECEVCKGRLTEGEIQYRLDHGVDLTKEVICDECWEREKRDCQKD